MENILLNIDSRYRDTTQYPSESKFRINLEKSYKNIISAKVISVEINNSINWVDSKKNNNYITLHLPNKINDPTGSIIRLDDGLVQSGSNCINLLSTKLSTTLNSNTLLHNLNPERYFYIFYMNNDITIYFDFEKTLTIKAGWISVYGMALQIQTFVAANTNGNYRINNIFNINVFDRRFRNSNLNLDCIRVDTINLTTNIFNVNNNILKQSLYSVYVSDVTNFIPGTSPQNNGILDRLFKNAYIIPNGYYNAGVTLNSASVYHINNTPTIPNNNSVQAYNMNATNNSNLQKTSINNSVGESYYYHIGNNTQTWANNNNTMNNLLDKFYLLNEGYITLQQLNDMNYRPSLSKDIMQFEIDFTSGSSYPSIGYYLGYRGLNILTPNINNIDLSLTGTRILNTMCDLYFFIRVNDWGLIELNNMKLLTKVNINSYTNLPKLNSKTDTYVDYDYKFRQPVNVQRLDIELVDYMGNTLDLNGYDFSLTLELTELYESDMKVNVERQNLVFRK